MDDTKAKRCSGCGVLTRPDCLQYVDDSMPACCKACEAEIVSEDHDDGGRPCVCECCATWRDIVEGRRRAQDARACGGLSAAGIILLSGPR